jgi:CRISPR-associated protein Cmr3
MKIFIEPNDVLMFRDGKPFSGGDDHYARGSFPPSPATFYGAIRSKILSDKFPQYEHYSRGYIPDDIKNEIGTPSSIGTLSITNFLLARRIAGNIEPVFSVPKDIVKIKAQEERFILKPEAQLANHIKSNSPIHALIPLWLKNEMPVEEVSGFISLETMNKYLEGSVPSKLIDNDDLFTKEERVGIGKDRIRKTASTGLLYSVEYFRLKTDVGFIVELNGVKSLPKEGLLRLGGDHRSAIYKEITFQNLENIKVKQMVDTSKRFKLILLTPAIFNNGWIPSWIDSKNGEGNINGVSLKIVSAAVGKPAHIGGFDFVKEMPKDMKKAVPAGGVYYFEIKQGSIDEIFDLFWMKSISDEKRQEGFGITIIGGY